MKASEVSFRDVYHKICFIEAGKHDAITESMPNYEEGNGTLVYGYIDCQERCTLLRFCEAITSKPKVSHRAEALRQPSVIN